MSEENHTKDALLPAEMARVAENIGVNKVSQDIVKTFALAILAGAFIAFGAIFSSLVVTGSTLPFGITKLMGGLAFSLGLILVVVGGAELFTGNNLITMAWAGRKVSFAKMMQNWLVVYLGNMLGAFSIVILILLSGHPMMGDGLVGSKILEIAQSKCQLGFTQAVVLGILCNILVCLAIWLCYSARTTQGKILAIIFPITAFVAAGFEHSVANMYFIPAGLLLKATAQPEFWELIQSGPGLFPDLNWTGFIIYNLLPVSIGNIIGGAGFVGLAYWFIYLRKNSSKNKN